VRHNAYGVPSSAMFVILSLSVLLSIVGCMDNRARVLPVSNFEVAALNADDVVRVMQRAGFSDEQILELGTDLRNALSQSGTAQIKVEDAVEAIFTVRGDYIYGTSRLRGSFIYDRKTARIR
jgi:hypothetical protein